MIERVYLEEIVRRIEGGRKFIQVLYGARQVGKTTMMRQLSSRLQIPTLFFSADNRIGGEQAWLREIWSRARLRLKEMSNPEAES